MISRNFVFLIFSAVLLLNNSCQYPLDKENFTDVPQPEPFHQFDLSLISQNDTISVFNNAEFSYNLNTYGLEILKGEFSMGSKKWNVYDKEGKFSISPTDYTAGIDTLLLVLFTKSGNGSIAEAFGAEGYKVEKRWICKVDGRPAPVIISKNSITKEGYLKISWNKCEQLNFKAYEFTFYANGRSISKTISYADSTTYIDSLYVGSEATIRVSSRVYTNNQYQWGNILEIKDSIPTLKFENKGVDSLRIYWYRSKYKAKYKLVKYSPNTVLLQSASNTSFTILHPGFGAYTEFTLYTLPYKLNTTETWDTKYDTKFQYLGRIFGSNSPNYAYNFMDKTLYTSSYDDVESYDISTLTLQNKARLTNLIFQGSYSCPTNSTKVATVTNDNIYVFPDKNLQNPEITPYFCQFKTFDHFYLTDNDLVAVAMASKYELISMQEKKVIATLNITDYPYYSKWACISTSRDGQYVCIVTRNGLKLYHFENNDFTLTYSDTRAYRSVLFDINNPTQMLITMYGNNTLEIRNTSNFDLINSIPLPTISEVIRNIDPETGYLLLTDYTYLYVMNLNTSQNIYKIRSSDYEPKLYGNWLFSQTGYCYDISKYLN